MMPWGYCYHLAISDFWCHYHSKMCGLALKHELLSSSLMTYSECSAINLQIAVLLSCTYLTTHSNFARFGLFLRELLQFLWFFLNLWLPVYIYSILMHMKHKLFKTFFVSIYISFIFFLDVLLHDQFMLINSMCYLQHDFYKTGISFLLLFYLLININAW